MNYIELNVPVTSDEQAEVLTALLADLPFESFLEDSGILKCYIPADSFPANKEAADTILAGLGVEGRYIEIEDRNWNELWESNFEPVEVRGICTIRAPFHAPAKTPLEVVIMPKMSFGTGHHATTALMVEAMLCNELRERRVLDVGSGTGVLAILAAKCGAEAVDAVDTDSWAYENSLENIAANSVEECVIPFLGDISQVEGNKYEVILANINLNILLADMERYLKLLDEGGMLIMSGILQSDIPALTAEAQRLGLTPGQTLTRDGWAAAEFHRI